MEVGRVSKEVVIKDKYYSSHFSSEPVLDTRGDEEFTPWKLD